MEDFLLETYYLIIEEKDQKTEELFQYISQNELEKKNIDIINFEDIFFDEENEFNLIDISEIEAVPCIIVKSPNDKQIFYNSEIIQKIKQI